MWRWVIAVAAAGWMGGCQSVPSDAPRVPPVVHYQRNIENKYPRVFLHLRAPDSSGEAFLSELRASGMFEDVSLEDAFRAVSLHVNLVRRMVTREGELGKQMLSAATAFVVPVDYTFATRVDVAVAVSGALVWKGSFEQEAKTTAFLLHDPFAEQHRTSRALIARMFAQMQEEKVFEETVPTALARRAAP